MINDEISSSNIISIVEKSLTIATNVSDVWTLSQFDEKRKLQQMIFPDGILYNKKKDLVRTPRINSIFAPIPLLTGILKSNKKSRLNKRGLTSQEVVPPEQFSNRFIEDLKRLSSLAA